MTTDETTPQSAGSIRPDQIGKVFSVLSKDVRQCLICEGVFSRQASIEHAKAACHPVS
jgi:hypothetical protein